MKQGKIVHQVSNLFYVKSDDIIYKCESSKILVTKDKKLCVGVEVYFDVIGKNNGYIKKYIQPDNYLTRPRVANVKYSLIVFSYSQPSFSTMLLDKLLLICEYHMIKPIIVMTKLDITDDETLMNINQKLDYYRNLYTVILKDDTIYKKISEITKSEIIFVQGQSGVGKSTLLNDIGHDLNIKTNEISLKLNRGKHTTTDCRIFEIKDLNIIDTPGFSQIDISQIINEFELSNFYKDFFNSSCKCKFKANCTHTKEPDCEVKRKVESGFIPKFRYNNYISIRESILNSKKQYNKKTT